MKAIGAFIELERNRWDAPSSFAAAGKLSQTIGGEIENWEWLARRFLERMVEAITSVGKELSSRGRASFSSRT